MPGFWVAAGFCAHGLAGAGGVGKVMAEWIVDGQPEYDVWHMDLKRFGRHYRSQRYTLARTYEALSKYYDIKYPADERKSARPLRVSPAYARLAALGAAFGEKAGWERANWFASQRRPTATRRCARAAGRGSNWSPAIGAEALATRARRRHLRPVELRQARGARPRRDGLPRGAGGQRDRPARRLASSTRSCSTRAAASSATCR